MTQPKTPKKKGRKKGTKQPFQIRCEPINIEKIRIWIKDNNL